MDNNKAEQLEVEFLLRVVGERYGYDFSGYARASLVRRLRFAAKKSGCDSISALASHLLRAPDALLPFLRMVTVSITEMFRDPYFFRALRDEVVPVLASYPKVRIWCAGCATGEEAYSLAILCSEAGLLDRAEIFATDIDNAALEVGRQGIYPLDAVRRYAKNHAESGGARPFSDYFHARYGAARFSEEVRRAITFAQHNLVGDWVFAEPHLIVCRNVLIYFDKPLQERVTKLFDESLCHRGFLALGAKERVASEYAARFETVDATSKIFRQLRRHSEAA